MASNWLETVKNSKKTCLIQDGRRKVHFALPDGREMVEEYDMRSDELVVRKWRVKRDLCRNPDEWEFEVGEDVTPRQFDLEGLRESSSNPIFLRADCKNAFQWRIRNLPYPVATYDIQVHPQDQVIIIRTTNRKYYKKFSISDLDRLGIPLEQARLSYAHANNTLIIKYEKPSRITQLEKSQVAEYKQLKAMKDGEGDCKPS